MNEPMFRKSSYSGSGNDCVEVADVPGASVVRDTRNRDEATLLFPSAEWRAFLTAVASTAINADTAP